MGGRALSLACLLGALSMLGVTATAQYPSRQAAPQVQVQRSQAPPSADAGKTMYFSKPADALVPLSNPGNSVSLASNAVPPDNGMLPDVAPPTPLPVPGPGLALPPIPDRPISVPSTVSASPMLQEQPKGKGAQPDDPIANQKYTKLPPTDVIFQLPNDAVLEKVIIERIRENLKGKDIKGDNYLKFPPVDDPTRGLVYVAKTGSYPPSQVAYDALYIVHRRLHFEDMNTERYGWDLGIVQPFFSAMTFYKDVLLWPNSLASGFAYGFWDTNAGKCLPGSPTPYMLYPPGLTITGSVFEGVIITGAAFAFP